MFSTCFSKCCEMAQNKAITEKNIRCCTKELGNGTAACITLFHLPQFTIFALQYNPVPHSVHTRSNLEMSTREDCWLFSLLSFSPEAARR